MVLPVQVVHILRLVVVAVAVEREELVAMGAVAVAVGQVVLFIFPQQH